MFEKKDPNRIERVKGTSNYYHVYQDGKIIGNILQGGIFGEGRVTFTALNGETKDLTAHRPTRNARAYKKFLGFLRERR